MLESLKIKNFRLFENLEIEGLKQVNLIAGKNNSGKTALLEALRILAAEGDSTVVNNIIYSRGQFTPNWEESYDSLFYRDNLAQQKNDEPFALEINELTIQRVKSTQHRTYCQTFWKGTSRNPNLNSGASPDFPNDRLIYLPFLCEQFFPLEKLWRKIVLTPLEDEVQDILQKTIAPDLVRLDVKENQTLVRLKNPGFPLPLKNLGDGAQRMLLLATALVSAKNNMLLIDEMEAGLHYSVIEKLWELIFEYAKEFNVQVFVTTHSSDVIQSFTKMLEMDENERHGVYFRLQKARKTGQLEAIAYDLENLEISLDAQLEPR